MSDFFHPSPHHIDPYRQFATPSPLNLAGVVYGRPLSFSFFSPKLLWPFILDCKIRCTLPSTLTLGWCFSTSDSIRLHTNGPRGKTEKHIVDWPAKLVFDQVTNVK